jgi:hypothetical protein
MKLVFFSDEISRAKDLFLFSWVSSVFRDLSCEKQTIRGCCSLRKIMFNFLLNIITSKFIYCTRNLFFEHAKIPKFDVV